MGPLAIVSPLRQASSGNAQTCAAHPCGAFASLRRTPPASRWRSADLNYLYIYIYTHVERERDLHSVLQRLLRSPLKRPLRNPPALGAVYRRGSEALHRGANLQICPHHAATYIIIHAEGLTSGRGSCLTGWASSVGTGLMGT